MQPWLSVTLSYYWVVHATSSVERLHLLQPANMSLYNCIDSIIKNAHLKLFALNTWNGTVLSSPRLYQASHSLSNQSKLHTEIILPSTAQYDYKSCPETFAPGA